MRIVRSLASIAVVAGVVIASAGTAQAASWPTPGKACKNSGMTVTSKSMTYICSMSADGLVWGKGKPVTKSKLTITDQWVKSADSGMTAAFGVISNPTNKPVRLVGASTGDATFMQIHEVVSKDGSMVMQQKPGGLVVPAKGSVTLKPGGDHLMLLGLKAPIKAGDMEKFTLTAADGSQLTFTAMGRVYTGANENYDPNGGMSHGSGMSMN